MRRGALAQGPQVTYGSAPYRQTFLIKRDELGKIIDTVEGTWASDKKCAVTDALRTLIIDHENLLGPQYCPAFEKGYIMKRGGCRVRPPKCGLQWYRVAGCQAIDCEHKIQIGGDLESRPASNPL
jgi:hypothetical protein